MNGDDVMVTHRHSAMRKLPNPITWYLNSIPLYDYAKDYKGKFYASLGKKGQDLDDPSSCKTL